MTDYTWPSVFFAYFFFLICFVGAIYFFVRSWKDGYWDPAGEKVKFQVFEDESAAGMTTRRAGEEEMDVSR